MKKKSILLIIILFFFILTNSFFIQKIKLTHEKIHKDLKLNKQINITNKQDITKYNNQSNDINYKKIITNLKNEYNNNDIVGKIDFFNTNKIFTIVQTHDNDYYLNHTPDNKKNSKGAIFLDYRVNIENSKKLLIYGHSSKISDYPFNFLQNYHDKNYYDNNKYFEVTTSNGIKKYEIFSVYVETKDFSYMETDFVNNDEYLSHIESLKDKSLHKTDIQLTSEDEILIIQTCSTHKDYKNYKDKYLLIISRRVKENEKNSH